MNIMGMVAFDLICRANSKPDPSGKPISRITRSQSPSFNLVSALCLVSTHATSYFSRSRRSCKVAPSERSSSTSNRRFIVGTHASGVQLFVFGSEHAGGARDESVGQIKSSDKARVRPTLKLNRPLHSLHELAHDIKAHPTTAAAAVSHKQPAQL